MLEKEEIELIKKEFGQHNPIQLGIFGSFARNEATPDSDVDLLVKFSKPISLLDIIGIEQSLSDQLKRKVEIVTERALSKRIRTSVMRDLRIII